MSNQLYCAIDPGSKGAVAWQEGGGILVRSLSDPPCMDDLAGIMPSAYTVVVEEIPMGGWGPIPQSTVAKLHQGYGRILGLLEARGNRIVRVTPQAWQRACSAGAKRDHGKGWKKHLAQLARERCPSVDFKVDQADALLILDMAIRQRL